MEKEEGRKGPKRLYPLHPTIQRMQMELKVEGGRLTSTGASRGVLDLEESLGVGHDCG